MPAYKYTPLDYQTKTTRLLSLLPGARADEIHVSLKIVHLTDDQLRFQALSYTWGSTDNPVQVLATDLPENINTGYLHVTQNLAVALQHLRLVDSTRDLWIDAVCVDQQNLEERGQQVERMSEIYHQAQQVVVWLGPSSKDSSLAIETLRSLGSKVEAPENLAAFSREVQHCIRGRIFYTTSEGSLGSALVAAKPGDHICVLLGCKSPLVIRQYPNGSYAIIGECYLHGMMEGQALLGPLSSKWKPVLIYAEGIDEHRFGFVNRETGEQKLEDLRLGQLPSGWRLNDPDSKPDGRNWFINDETGEQFPWSSDPRMTPEALKARGVSLQDFVF
ncbi:MAG: hypothetical protein Q9226_002793, partial [Calogaya cf. arnoldii]